MKESIKYYLKSVLSPEELDRIRSSAAELAGLARKLNTRSVPMNKLLWGGEQGTLAAKYARITNNFLRPSTPLRDTPHVDLLQRYKCEKESLLEPEVFKTTKYYRNALEALDITGSYFGCNKPDLIVLQARRFITDFKGQNNETLNSPLGISSRSMPVLVCRIAYSDGCFEIVDGHHRLAIAYARGAKRHRVHILKQRAVLTPLQQRLLDVFWTKGLRLLYQPVSAPEIGSKWRKIRQCVDRRDMIAAFLRNNELMPPLAKSYLDLGSNYGWFVSEMTKLGFDAWGVDRDSAAVSLGPQIYGISPNRVIVGNLASYLDNNDRVYDVTSCFSVLHHFVLGNGPISAETLMKRIDRTTGKVLFFDTGQNHELWFKHSLTQWTPEYIAEWIKRHSSFNNVIPLGIDQDYKLPGQSRNYGRTLFACTR
jgi:SAM-dependent methyltransferase